ncbi:hypothetical protein C2G38_2137768 [Gigaspora rosea]|uniref:BTB domain-containing protein n=1 Tax=Gigaspora rosea TaxID=44941 RepID=A0A397W1V7_9GLOM|nr:hypothetical protein C2G38_2137768 [Gigaspora rosea]
MSLDLFEELSQDFTQLLESGYDYNVVIQVGERPNIQLFKGHSAILYQRSLYFRQNLVNAIKKNNIIEIKLPHISPKIFNIIIKFIYDGKISLENFEVPVIFDLLVSASGLKITRLTEYIQFHLLDNNASWLRLNFPRVYKISFLDKSFGPLQEFCNDIIVKQPSLIFHSDNFITLNENALISLLKRDDLQMEESEIWDKMILWGKARIQNLSSNPMKWTDENFKSLKIILHHCLPHIRYFQISGKNIIKKIKPYRKILEENVWDDITTKFIDPDAPITLPILPPRKKESVQVDFSSTSSIITSQHKSSWSDRSLKIRFSGDRNSSQLL